MKRVTANRKTDVQWPVSVPVRVYTRERAWDVWRACQGPIGNKALRLQDLVRQLFNDAKVDWLADDE